MLLYELHDIEQLDEISRRGFIKAAVGAATAVAMPSVAKAAGGKEKEKAPPKDKESAEYHEKRKAKYEAKRKEYANKMARQFAKKYPKKI